MSSIDYIKIARVFEKIPTYSLVPIGRAGSMLLHSLLDAHHEIISLPGVFYFEKFWEEIRCQDNSELLAEEFIWHKNNNLDNIRFFFSKYDNDFGMDALGRNQNQVFVVDPDQFKSHFSNMISAYGVANAKTVFLTIHAAYALTQGMDPSLAKIILLHSHDMSSITSLAKYLPDINFLCPIRNPFESIHADLSSRKFYKRESYSNLQLYSNLKVTLFGLSKVSAVGNRVVVVKLEELNSVRHNLMTEICKSLNLTYGDCLLVPTFNNITWVGDKLTKMKKNDGQKEGAMRQASNSFFWYDRMIIEHLFNEELRACGYVKSNSLIKSPLSWAVALLLTPLPMKFESDIFCHLISNWNENGRRKEILYFMIFYVRRVVLYYKKLFDAHIEMSKIEIIKPGSPSN